MGIKAFLVSVLATTYLFANLSIAVIDFDAGGHCTNEQAVVITNLFRNELIRSGRANVADRGNMERILAEMQFQMSDWADPSRIKAVGRMIGADYLITGQFSKLGDNLHLIVQMLDIETARAVNSSRITLANVEEFNERVKAFAADFIQKLPAGNIFTGTWSADVMHGDVIDNYVIIFGPNNRCRIEITSLVNGREFAEDVDGTYSYDGEILRINAVLRESGIPHLRMIQWRSVVSMSADNTSFNMSIIPSRASNNQMRTTFIRH